MFDFFNTDTTFLTDCRKFVGMPFGGMLIGDTPIKFKSCGHFKYHFMTLVVALACKDGVVLAADGLSAGYGHEFFAHNYELFRKFFFVAYPPSKRDRVP